MSKTPGKKLYEKSYEHSGIKIVSEQLKIWFNSTVLIVFRGL